MYNTDDGIYNKAKDIYMKNKRKYVVESTVAMLIIFPLILGLMYIKFFGISVIAWDQCALVPIIEKLHIGTLTFGDLFAQHNEHRIFFPRVIMLVLAYVTQYNTVAEMYFSWILTVSILVLTFQMYRRDFGDSIYTTIKFIPIAWIIFNFRQYENILWGWQIQIYLSVLGFIATIYLLNKSKKVDKWLVMAVLCGILSTFSFFNGLLVWPVGIVFIILSRTTDRKNLVYLWTIVGVLIWSIYFYDWTKPSYHPSLLFALNNILDAVKYIMTNIGSPLAFESGQAFAMGIILVVFMLITVVLIIGNKLIIKNSTWITFILFSLMSSFILTIGRSGFGVVQASSSRYVTITSLGIIGLYSIIANMTKDNKNMKIFYGIFLFIILTGIVIGYTGGMKIGNDISKSREHAANDLINYKSTNDTDLKKICPDANVVRKYAEILERYKLNVFSNRN